MAGTVEVPVLGQPSSGLFPGHFALLGNKLAFSGSSSTGGLSGLYVSDGTTAGTTLVPISGSFTGPNIQDMASLGDRVVFSGVAPPNRLALWVSDGTTAGTTVLDVPGLNPDGGYNGDPAGMTAFGTRVAFTAATASGAIGVWTTDGTVAGTTQLPGVTAPPYGTSMAALPDGRLAFIAADSAGVARVWLTDGTAASTAPLAVPGASASGLNPLQVMVLGDQLVFDGTAASGSRALFLSDGTPAGTTVLASGFSLADYIGVDSVLLPGSTVRGSVRNDVFVDGPAEQTFVGYGGRDVLALSDGRRGAGLAVAGDSVTVSHRGQADTLRGIEELRFIDGRVVFDASDPAAQVARLYQAGLGRPADQGGLNFWTANIQAGAPLADLATGFLTSAEFTARYGSGLANQAFVTRIYLNVLGRDPEAGGLAFWTGALDRGVASRGEVLAGISESGENKAGTAALVGAGIWDRSEAAQQVARLYDTALGRLPDAGGLGFWTAAIERGTGTLLDLAQSFVTSGEFVASYGALGNQAFVEKVYGNTLGRAGDPGGVDFWTGQLNSGVSRAQVTIGFSESTEHQNRTAASTGGEAPDTYGVKLA